jgi:hypothetical protein
VLWFLVRSVFLICLVFCVVVFGEVRVPHLFSFGCCIFLRPVSFVNLMLPVFLDCSMLIYPSLFSNVYLRRGLQFVFSLFTREA